MLPRWFCQFPVLSAAMKYLKISMQRIYYIQSLAVRKDLQSRSISFSNAQFNFSMISQLIMFSSWLLPSIKFSWKDFSVVKSSSLSISSCWRSLIICNLRALCRRKWPLKALLPYLTQCVELHFRRTPLACTLRTQIPSLKYQCFLENSWEYKNHQGDEECVETSQWLFLQL